MKYRRQTNRRKTGGCRVALRRLWELGAFEKRRGRLPGEGTRPAQGCGSARSRKLAERAGEVLFPKLQPADTPHFLRLESVAGQPLIGADRHSSIRRRNALDQPRPPPSAGGHATVLLVSTSGFPAQSARPAGRTPKKKARRRKPQGLERGTKLAQRSTARGAVNRYSTATPATNANTAP